VAPTRRDPFKDLLFLQDRMSRIFDEAFTRYKGCPEPSGGLWHPPVDIYESEEQIVLNAELPGLEIGDVEIEVDESTLVIKGERRFEKNLSEENYHRMECFYGSFHRVFTLPYAVDSSRIRASLKDGVLKITVPKHHAEKKTGVKVKVQ